MVLFVCWYAPVFCSHHWFFSYNCYYDYYIQWLLFFKFWLDKLSFFLLFLSFSCFQNNFVIYIIGSPVFWHSRTNPVIYIYYSITNGYLLSLSLSYPVLPSCIPSSIGISDSLIKYLGHILRHPVQNLVSKNHLLSLSACCPSWPEIGREIFRRSHP